MRLYTPWFPPPRREASGKDAGSPILVRDGFSFWALPFGWLVLLRPGSWLCAALGALATVLVTLLAREIAGGWALLAGLHLLIAAFAADWRSLELKLGGYAAGPVVAAGDRVQALLRLFEHRPDLTGQRV